MSAVGEKSSQIQFPKLEFSKDPSNNVDRLVKLINDGNIIALYTSEATRVFHCIDRVDLSQRRVLYFNCNSHPGLLAPGEWDDRIRQKIPTLIEVPYGDALRNKIIEQTHVPHKEYLKLGY